MVCAVSALVYHRSLNGWSSKFRQRHLLRNPLPSLWHITRFMNSALFQGQRGKQLLYLLVYFKIHSFKCQPCTTTLPTPPPALFCPFLKQNIFSFLPVFLMDLCNIKVYLPINLCVVLHIGCPLLLSHPILTLQIFFYTIFKQIQLPDSFRQFKSLIG